MDFLSNPVVLSRMQFALTAIFHMLWPVLTTGMAIYLVIVEGLWLKTRNRDYYYHARFWSKLYVLNFGIGVATGKSAAWSLVAIPNEKAERNDWEISIPNLLGYILELKPKLSEPVQGLKEWQPENRPHLLGLIYYAFRIMIAIGVFFAGLMALTVLQ